MALAGLEFHYQSGLAATYAPAVIRMRGRSRQYRGSFIDVSWSLWSVGDNP